MDEKTGGFLTSGALAERVGWCADLVSAMASDLLAEHWNASDVDALASGEDSDGRRLPTNAWMALRRLGWSATAPGGVKVNDRIVRMAQEEAGRILRSAKYRADLITGVLASWPADPLKRTAREWDAVRTAVPGGRHAPSSVIKGRTREIIAFAKANGGRLPVDVFEAEDAPGVARVLLLSSCDRQQVTIERCDDPTRALLRLQLPTRPDPTSYRDWTWVACPIALPPTIPAHAILHLPTLRFHGGQVRADIAFTHAVPNTSRTGHTIALGVDWGLNTLLSAGTVSLGGDGRMTAHGAGGMFRAAGVLAKQHRLRRLSEHLRAKSDHYQRLAAGRGLGEGPVSKVQHGKQAVLRDEIRRVSARRSNLNDALAWAAARWAVDQAVAAGAGVIYLEDLRSMEAGGMGRTMNTRLSHLVRAKITDRLRHLAAEIGIAVVTVPARGTSKNCPNCLAPLRHSKSPDRPAVPGWKWALCPSCGYQGDRDQGAWRRIAARGLAHQAKTVADRASGNLVIRALVDTLEAVGVITPTVCTASHADRSKTGPTRPQTTRPAPRRRGVPSPSRPPGVEGKRPGGHASTDRSRLPRAAHRHQSVTTISVLSPGPRPEVSTSGHRPQGAALGAGFHLHVHASRPRWETIPDTRSGTGSLR
ncbi:zinc ribbon domain-containing protein [Streptomyces goshikiensis]|uniref:zinc ribbon domain-containing protein n=1 Tax=Streptomyces goshikiensis TaxID=1942 RepID=UPI0037173358